MTKKSSTFSGPSKMKLPTMKAFKAPTEIDDPIPAEHIEQKKADENLPIENKSAESEVVKSDQPAGSNISELELLKTKTKPNRSQFTTTLSADAINKLNKMKLAFDANFSDLVEHSIDLVYAKHEKDILKLIKKKLM